MSSILKQLFTGIDGATLDPARVIGYGSSLAIVATFIFNSIWAVTHGAAFDMSACGIGGSAILAGIMAVGVGVGAKAKTEPTP